MEGIVAGTLRNCSPALHSWDFREKRRRANIFKRC
jgi:hypothetical protein